MMLSVVTENVVNELFPSNGRVSHRRNTSGPPEPQTLRELFLLANAVVVSVVRVML